MKPAKSSPQGGEGGRGRWGEKVAEYIIVQKVWEIHSNWAIEGGETEASRTNEVGFFQLCQIDDVQV